MTYSNITLAGVWIAPSLSLQNDNPDAYRYAMEAAPKSFGDLGRCENCGRALRDNYLVSTDQGRAVFGSECFAKLQASEATLDAVELHARRVAAIKRDRSKTEKRLAKLVEYRELLTGPAAGVPVGKPYPHREGVHFAADRSGADMKRERGGWIFHPESETGRLWSEQLAGYLKDIDAEAAKLRKRAATYSKAFRLN